MSDQAQRHAEDGGGARVSWQETSYDAYESARERFLARLRRDTEVRRLEGLWQLAAAPGGEEDERCG